MVSGSNPNTLNASSRCFGVCTARANIRAQALGWQSAKGSLKRTAGVCGLNRNTAKARHFTSRFLITTHWSKEILPVPSDSSRLTPDWRLLSRWRRFASPSNRFSPLPGSMGRRCLARAWTTWRIDSWLSEIFTQHPASARSGKCTATTASIQMLG